MEDNEKIKLFNKQLKDYEKDVNGIGCGWLAFIALVILGLMIFFICI